MGFPPGYEFLRDGCQILLYANSGIKPQRMWFDSISRGALLLEAGFATILNLASI
jgi:hypothetical protein